MGHPARSFTKYSIRSTSTEDKWRVLRRGKSTAT